MTCPISQKHLNVIATCDFCAFNVYVSSYENEYCLGDKSRPGNYVHYSFL